MKAKCKLCEAAAVSMVGDDSLCGPHDIEKQTRLVKRRLEWLYGPGLDAGVHVKISYRVGPRYGDAQKYGRILEIALLVGTDPYQPGMLNPRGAFRVRLNDGAVETHYPEHLLIVPSPKPKLIKGAAT